MGPPLMREQPAAVPERDTANSAQVFVVGLRVFDFAPVSPECSRRPVGFVRRGLGEQLDVADPSTREVLDEL